MTCWSEGYAAMRAALERDTFPLADFIEKFHDKARVAGTAVYLTSRTDVVPVALLHNLKHNKVIHRTHRPAQCDDRTNSAHRSREAVADRPICRTISMP